MKTTFYVITNRAGTVRTTKNPPGLDHGEVAVKVALNIPDQVFLPQRIPDVTLEVPAGAIRRAPEPTAEVEVSPTWGTDCLSCEGSGEIGGETCLTCAGTGEGEGNV